MTGPPWRLVAPAVVWLAAAGSAQDWTPLIERNSLDGWQSSGDGVWRVMRDGTLLGDRRPQVSRRQAWLYTKKNYGEFDLQLEYWVNLHGNSGVSVRDNSRARYAGGDSPPGKTPARFGYEVQITNDDAEEYPGGSIYLFAVAKRGLHETGDWNRLEIRVRDEGIRVTLNGRLASEHSGDPARPKTGPVGLQMHDPGTVVMFRNVRIREVRRGSAGE